MSHYPPNKALAASWLVSVLRETLLNLCWKSYHCQCVITSTVSWLRCWCFILSAGHRSHSYSLLELSSQESNEERQCYRAQHSDHYRQAQQIGHQFCAKNGKLDTIHKYTHREMWARCVWAQWTSWNNNKRCFHAKTVCT